MLAVLGVFTTQHLNGLYEQKRQEENIKSQLDTQYVVAYEGIPLGTNLWGQGL